jgi:predicted RNase H-like HicB family nuclease
MTENRQRQNMTGYSIVLKEDRIDGGYVATVPELPGCISDGDTREQALEHIKEAIGLYLESDE